MCFIEERYARGLERGGMLGYVFDDDIESARSSVAASIGSNHGQLQCARTPGFGPSSVLKNDFGVSESSHSISSRSFKIYHVFLPV
jgi:hypothetical protein